MCAERNVTKKEFITRMFNHHKNLTCTGHFFQDISAPKNIQTAI